MGSVDTEEEVETDRLELPHECKIGGKEFVSDDTLGVVVDETVVVETASRDEAVEVNVDITEETTEVSCDTFAGCSDGSEDETLGETGAGPGSEITFKDVLGLLGEGVADSE